MGKRYVASSRRRRGSRWPIIAIVAAALVAAVIIFMPEGSGPDNVNAADDGIASPNDVEVPAGSPGSITRAETAKPPVTRSITPPAGSNTGNTGTTAPRTPSNTTQTRQPNITAPPTTNNTTPPRTTGTSRTYTPSATVEKAFNQAHALVKAGQLVQARTMFSDLLLDKGSQLTPGDQQNIRDAVAELNEKLIFSDKAYGEDPLVDVYTVKSGDVLTTIASKFHVNTELVQRINGITNPNKINLGQKIKVVKGPFHLRVDKSDFRLDLLLARPDGRLEYVTSYTVGIGADDSTPVGTFLVTDRVKNPAYTHPRTKERFAGGDPKNPVGKYWLRLEGMDENTKKLESYGIHGTIEPQTVGTQASLGCVRMLDKDIEELYGVVAMKRTKVEIVP